MIGTANDYCTNISYLTFFSELTNNQSWHQFVESYHLCRKKSGGEFIQELWELDKLVSYGIGNILYIFWLFAHFSLLFTNTPGVFLALAPRDLC